MTDGPLILIVEDEEPLRTIAADILALYGYRTALAADGDAALRWMAGGDWPDALLLDMAMPAMGGIELLERLRAGYGRVPPVVITTAYAVPHQTAGLTAAAGALVAPSGLRVLTKPYSMEDLKAALAAVLAAEQGA